VFYGVEERGKTLLAFKLFGGKENAVIKNIWLQAYEQ